MNKTDKQKIMNDALNDKLKSMGIHGRYEQDFIKYITERHANFMILAKIAFLLLGISFAANIILITDISRGVL